MWYIFLQYEGLGHNSNSKKYSIQSVEEALSYFCHPVLGQRLLETTNAYLLLKDKTAFEVLGKPDDFKMKSCMTLFNAIQAETDIFSCVLDKYYFGLKCEKTILLIE